MARTALQIAQDAAVKLGLDRPSQMFTASGRTEQELSRALIEAADKIVQSHDWQLLKTLVTHEGDGTTTEYAPPSDFLRMPKDAEIWSTRWQHPLAHITPEDWLNLDVREYDVVTGSWTIYGGNFVYKPALAVGEDARFFYVSANCVADEAETPKAAFTADLDTFRLDDRVLELVLVWVWRAQKSLDYAEEQAAAEIALARAIERDKGPRMLAQPTRRAKGAKMAFPWSITP